jgi:hypothetical protein
VEVYDPFFFAEPSVTGISYLDMLENYLMPQLQQDMDRDLIFQQDGAPPHFYCNVTSHLNRTVVAWIGRDGTTAWPPRLPEIIPLDHSVWRGIKDKAYVPPLPGSLEELWV